MQLNKTTFQWAMMVFKNKNKLKLLLLYEKNTSDENVHYILKENVNWLSN
jgi:hypothetical protein